MSSYQLCNFAAKKCTISLSHCQHLDENKRLKYLRKLRLQFNAPVCANVCTGGGTPTAFSMLSGCPKNSAAHCSCTRSQNSAIRWRGACEARNPGACRPL